MKILHLSSEATWRGGEQQIAYLLQESIKAKVQVMVLCRKDSPFEHFCQNENIPYKTTSFKHQYHLGTAKAIKKVCQQFKPDLLHLHSSKAHGAAILANLLGNKTSIILSRRVDFPVKKSWPTQFKYNHHSIKKIICVSDTIRKITAQGIQHPEKLVTIHSGIDINKFLKEKPDSKWFHEKFGIAKDKKLIGNTSALAPHKDYFTFIDTAHLLLQKRNDLHFLIIGKGALKAELQAYVKQKGIENQITFTGFLKNIPEVLPQLDVFLMTSETEGLGTSVLDAFAAKVPVVATAGGGIPEMVIHKKTGMLAPIKAYNKLSEYVLEVLQNKKLNETLVFNASEKVKEFSKEITAAKNIAVYKKVLDIDIID